MGGSEIFLFGIPLSVETLLWIFIPFVLVVIILRKGFSSPSSNSAPSLPDQNQTLKLLLSRRTVSPKDYLVGGKLSPDQLEDILEAANWAPTHQKNEPWRYVVFNTPDQACTPMFSLDSRKNF